MEPSLQPALNGIALIWLFYLLEFLLRVHLEQIKRIHGQKKKIGKHVVWTAVGLLGWVCVVAILMSSSEEP